MNCFRELIGAMGIICFSVCKIFLKAKVTPEKKCVAIVFSGGLGDAVLFLPVLKDWIEFNQASNCSITLFLKRSSYELYELQGIPKEMMECIDFPKFCTDLRYYKTICNQYKKIYFQQVYVPLTSLTADIFTANLKSSVKIGNMYEDFVYKGFLRGFFRRYAYTSLFIESEKVPLIHSFGNFYQYITEAECVRRLPILKKEIHIIQKDYCLLTPFSSTYVKDWESEKYGALINKLIDKGIPVYLSVMKKDEKRVENIIKAVRNKQGVRIFSDTTVREMIALIQGAKIVAGVDSAPIHIAAASGIKSICILSGQLQNRIYPYQIEALDALIDVIRVDKKGCFGCLMISGKNGYGNKDCKKRIQKGDCALCVHEITIEAVWKEIKRALEKQESNG